MLPARGVLPMKKTQSRVLDRLIFQQCQENEKQRKLYQHTLHLKNSIICDTKQKLSNSLYCSQTASSQAKKKLFLSPNSKKQLRSSSQRKSNSKHRVTKPQSPRFCSRGRRGRANKQDSSKISYESSISAIIDEQQTQLRKKTKQRPRSAMPYKHSSNSRPRHVTKVVEFNFATRSRLGKRASKAKSSKRGTKDIDIPSRSASNTATTDVSTKTSIKSNSRKNTVWERLSNKSKPKRVRSISKQVSNRYQKQRSLYSQKSKANVASKSEFASFKKQILNLESSLRTQHKIKTNESSLSESRKSQKKLQNRPRTTHVPPNPKKTVSAVTTENKTIETSPIKRGRSKKSLNKPRRARQRSITQSEMKNMLKNEFAENTDWNEVYIASNRRRARSMTRGSQSRRHDISANGKKRNRNRSHSISARSEYADFVEDYALDALLTDDATRISDEDLKQLSRNASVNGSIDASPRGSIDSEFTYGELWLEDDMALNNELMDSSSVDFANSTNSQHGLSNDADHQIVTDIKNRFSKLDDLFGEISANVE